MSRGKFFHGSKLISMINVFFLFIQINKIDLHWFNFFHKKYTIFRRITIWDQSKNKRIFFFLFLFSLSNFSSSFLFLFPCFSFFPFFFCHYFSQKGEGVVNFLKMVSFIWNYIQTDICKNQKARRTGNGLGEWGWAGIVENM